MPGLQQRFSSIHSRIAQAAHRAGRNPADIQLIAVTKNVPIETIHEAVSLGVRHIGENKIQEALGKKKELEVRKSFFRPPTSSFQLPVSSFQLLASSVIWHMIGHLQTNKVRDAVQVFDWIHSVDSLRLAEKVNHEAEKIKKIMPVLIEVNVSGEQSKCGITPKDLPELIKSCQSLSSIRVEGLMTMAPVVSDPSQARPYFQHLARLRDQLNRGQTPISHLSMGMSQDFEAAIEEGATMVRIGTAIFERH